MKRFSLVLSLILLLAGCAPQPSADIAATTLPVYEFTASLCQGTGLTVTRLVTEQVSCLHDYSLQIGQMRAVESAKVVIKSGVGFEDFLEGALGSAQQVIDASAGVPLLEGNCHHHDDAPEHSHDHDPHIWLSPANGKIMAENICRELTALYPAHTATFRQNLQVLLDKLDALQAYGEATLGELSCRKLVTFHDGFGYFAAAFDLEILAALEEESGSEASAALLKELCLLVEANGLPAVFTEANGSTSAAGVISRETGAKCYALDMAMSGSSYFDAMYHNIHIIKEALG